jgi:hypothetical protein
MTGKIMVIPPDQDQATVFDVDLDGYLAVVATLQEHAIQDTVPVHNFELVCNVPKLNVRTGPGTYYPDVDDIYQGDLVHVFEVGGSDAWVRIGNGLWAACEIRGTKFLKIPD